MQMLEVAAAAAAYLAKVGTGFHLAGALHRDACDDDGFVRTKQAITLKNSSWLANSSPKYASPRSRPKLQC